MFGSEANKTILNFEKHGVAFEEAAAAFDDPPVELGRLGRLI